MIAFWGICCIISPCSIFPFACLFLLMPSLPHVPHCLKKKAEPCDSTCCLMLTAHCGFIGLTTDYYPINTSEIHISQILYQWLARQEFN